MLLKIGSTVETVKDKALVRSDVERTDAFGTTALHDAIVAAIDAVDASRGRRALVLLSDGNDRYSRATAEDVLTRTRAANVIVYPIAFGRDRPELFAELAALTGGRSFNTRNERDLSDHSPDHRPRAEVSVSARLLAVAAARRRRERVAIDCDQGEETGTACKRAGRLSRQVIVAVIRCFVVRRSFP